MQNMLVPDQPLTGMLVEPLLDAQVYYGYSRKMVGRT